MTVEDQRAALDEMERRIEARERLIESGETAVRNLCVELERVTNKANYARAETLKDRELLREKRLEMTNESQ